MNATPLRVTVDLQDATNDANLPDRTEWSRWVSAAVELAAADSANGSMTVRLVGRDEGQALNTSYRNQPGATNVLAFSRSDRQIPVEDTDRSLGDLVICLPVVYCEAKDQDKRPVAHMAHMVVHGTLHLLGFDHDTHASAERMEGLETQIMHRLGFPDPYAAG